MACKQNLDLRCDLIRIPAPWVLARCWDQNTSQIKTKDVYATLHLQATYYLAGELDLSY